MLHQIGSELSKAFCVSLGVAVLKDNIFALNLAKVAQALFKRFQVRLVPAADK